MPKPATNPGIPICAIRQLNALLRLLLVLLLGLTGNLPAALGEARRDVVFECPCDAEWVQTGPGSSGELTLNFGVRNFRASASGEVRLSFLVDLRVSRVPGESFESREFSSSYWARAGRIGPGAVHANQSATFALERPEPNHPILIRLYERIGELTPAVAEANPNSAWQSHEHLALWPDPEASPSGRIRFVDILTDTDGDGVGDANEHLAGTSAGDATDTPGESTLDVLALFDSMVFDAFAGDPYTRIHHVLTLAGALFADSGTNIRLRGVGMHPVHYNQQGWVDDYDALMDAHGADLVVQLHANTASRWPCIARTAGCAGIGGSLTPGLWTPAVAAVDLRTPALVTTHELGHVLGLAHSSRQGETSGAFRWSRGYYRVGADGQGRPRGTIMARASRHALGYRFSSSRLPCNGQPCGVPIDRPDGADAVASLDLLRFQAAASRTAIPDSDGDGFVDAVDAAPDDPGEWSDIDGDGQGENADRDDDNDGVPDGEDRFPFDAQEWADADGDGIGDNADDEVTDLSPFQDPGLRAAVEKALRKRPGAPIGDPELASLGSLDANEFGIRNLAGLELANSLDWLALQGNAITDIAPISHLSRLVVLALDANAISDLSPLARLTFLRHINLNVNALSDIAALAELRNVRELRLGHNVITDLSPLANLRTMRVLQVDGNAVTDLSPLARMSRLAELNLNDNNVSDLSPLADLRLEALGVGYNDLTLDDVRQLTLFHRIAKLDLSGLGLEEISALADLENPRELVLRDNAIVDVAPLAGLRGIELLDLSANDIADIGPLARRGIWNAPATEEPRLRLQGNPLDRDSIENHVPRLREWGIEVELDELPDDEPPVEIPDPVLRALIAHNVAQAGIFVDARITEGSIGALSTLRAAGLGLTDLTGLEAAERLEYLFLGANAVTDLSPLSGLPGLIGLDLSDNRITDIAALVGNADLDSGDWVVLDGNPLSEEAVNRQIPALLERGVEVSLHNVQLTLSGDRASFDTAGYFSAVLGSVPRTFTRVSNPALAHAEVVDGRLTVMPGASGGRVTVTITGMNGDGERATLTFAATLPGPVAVSTFPPASDRLRQGFMRVINPAAVTETLHIEAFDPNGGRRGPVSLQVGPGRAAQFNSDDLETGNAAKGLSGGVGRGNGDWRLSFDGNPDAEVLSYIRTEDGFLTAMHDLAPITAAGHDVAIFNPGSNLDQVSLLRLHNPGDQAAEITVTGIDDAGDPSAGAVTLSLGAGASRTLTARELESGEGLAGALGDGAGKWRLTVEADRPILVANLMQSPTGHLTNLSTLPDNKLILGAETMHRVPLFLAAADHLGRQGFVRVINRGADEATVRIMAWDHGSRPYGPVTLTVSAGATVNFNSNDLELGNSRKGLSAGIGAGRGSWNLELTSEAQLDVLAYARTRDGFLTSMHDVAPLTSEGYRVPIFNPGDNVNQESLLRLVNVGGRDASIVISGIDDRGVPGSVASTVLGARWSRVISAAELEDGTSLFGRLGDGTGKWRLWVTSDQPIAVMSLLQSRTGHLTNLSTTPH